MGMSEFYGKADYAQSRKTILTALDLGVNFLDTADTYGHGHNEELVGRVLKEWKGEIFVATKFGIVREPGAFRRTVNGRPEYARQAVEASLRRLNREVIDLYYLHRIDFDIPIEDTVGAMADLVREGKVRYLGISEALELTIRRAHRVYPLTAVQSEYSLFTRGVEKEVLPTLRELSIGFVSYSPLCRGLLTGQLNRELLAREGDVRQYMPRMAEDNLVHNQKIAVRITELAGQQGVTAAQLALAWILAKGEDIVPIPGTKTPEYLVENMKAAELQLSPEIMNEIESAIPCPEVRGERYGETARAGIEEYRPASPGVSG